MKKISRSLAPEYGKKDECYPTFFHFDKKFMENKTTATPNKGITINKPVNQVAPAGFARLSGHHILVIFLRIQVLVSARLKKISPHFPEV